MTKKPFVFLTILFKTPQRQVFFGSVFQENICPLGQYRFLLTDPTRPTSQDKGYQAELRDSAVQFNDLPPFRRLK